MPSPFDYAQLPGSPGAPSYAAPLLNFGAIGDLGKDWFQGTQQARTLNLQKPILGPDGQPTTDYATILNEVLKRGGGETAEKLLPGILGAQAGQNARNQVYPDQGGQQPNIGTNSSPHGQSPDMLRAAGQGQGGQPSAAGDNAADTVRSIATETGGPNRDLSAQIPNYAKVLGVGPDDPLSPAQAARMRRIIGSNVNPTGRAENNETTPVGTGANPGGAGIPAVTPPQQTGFAGRFNASTDFRTPITSLADVQQLEAMRDRALRAAGAFGVPKETADMLKEQAAKWADQAKQGREQLGKAAEQTSEEKNVTRGVEERKGQIVADLKYYDSLHRGLAGSAMIAAQQKQNIDMLRQVAASPNFTPGAGSDLALTVQRVAAQLGINPTGAAPREIFNQLSARILADQFSGIKSLASETGEQGARIFKPMLDIEEKANITPFDSAEGVKAKLDLIDKTGDLMMKWGDKADDYKLKHGRLDAGFDKELRSDIAKARVPNVVPGGAQAAPQGAPPVGHVEQGFRFKGGNHRDPKSWEPVAAGDRS